MERTCFRFVLHVASQNSFVFIIEISYILSYLMLLMFMLCFLRLLFITVNNLSLFCATFCSQNILGKLKGKFILNVYKSYEIFSLRMSFANSSTWSMSNVRVNEKSTEKHFHVLSSLTRRPQLSKSVDFLLQNFQRLSPSPSHEMSWMKMCFMSYYTILLFSISKFHSVFIQSWNWRVWIYRKCSLFTHYS